MRVAAMSAGMPLLLAACAGQVRTTSVAPTALEAGRSVKGVVVYQPTLVKLTYSFTTRVDKDGKVVGTTAERTCAQTIQKEELTMIADLQRPVLIANASGFLSAAKFSVTVSNGLLASVNAEPTQKASDLLTATSSLVKEIGVLAVPGDPVGACNAGPVLAAIQRVTLPE